MKIGLVVVAVAAVVVIYLLVGRERNRQEAAAPAPGILEERLALLAECGIALAPPHSVDSLFVEVPRADLEAPEWHMLLVALGAEDTDEKPGGNHCVNLWHFDTECIENHGDYARIVKRMAAMAQGSLPLEDVRDFVDIEADKASFSFTLKGKKYEVPCRVDNDWVDPEMFKHFVKLLAETDPAKVYLYYDLGGQDCLLGCVTREQLKRLNDAGIAFEPLS